MTAPRRARLPGADAVRAAARCSRRSSLHAEGKGVDAVHTGSLDGRPVVALLTGIGTDRAAARTRHLLAPTPSTT